MTFVRSRLALDRMAQGALLEIRFRGEEPRRNLPRAAEELGHEVLALDDLGEGYGRLVLRKSRASSSASRPGP